MDVQACQQKYYSFFKTVWIPDECFIQSIIMSSASSLTYYQFDKAGTVMFGSVPENMSNKFFFIRKYTGECA